MPNVEGHTTVAIPEDIHMKLKLRAVREKKTLQAMLEEVLRKALGGKKECA